IRCEVTGRTLGTRRAIATTQLNASSTRLHRRSCHGPALLAATGLLIPPSLVEIPAPGPGVSVRGAWDGSAGEHPGSLIQAAPDPPLASCLPPAPAPAARGVPTRR